MSRGAGRSWGGWARRAGPSGVTAPAGRVGRRGGAERTAPLVAVLAAGQLVLGVLVEEQVLLGRLVHPDGHHGQALEVFLLALGCYAVVVFLSPFGMQLAPAGNALGHKTLFGRTH